MAYITVEDMRNEDVANPPYSDADVTDRIVLAQKLIERILGCFFERRTGVSFRLDGRGHAWLRLPVPPISAATITSIALIETDKTETAYVADDWDLIMETFPDGRLDPQLRNCTGVWPEGKANIKIVGDFGFVDVTVVGEATVYSAPPEIKRLCKLITHWGLPKAGDDAALRAGQIVAESLKDYNYRLSEAAQSGMFGDKVMDRLLDIFKRPYMGTA